MLNSRLGLLSATFSPSFKAQLLRHPFSLSYGVNLPSSLTMVFSLALGFSPRLPVSVCSTGTLDLARGFSWQYGFGCFATCFRSPSLFNHGRTDLPTRLVFEFGRALPTARSAYPPASPLRSDGLRWHWNVHQLSIAYACYASA